MHIQKTSTTLVLLGAFLLAVLLGSTDCCRAGTTPEPQSDTIVATINGQPIRESALRREVNKDLEKYAKFGMKNASPELLKTLRNQALDRLIDNELLSQAIRGQDTADAKKKTMEELDALKKRHETPESFTRYLDMRRMTENDLLASLERQILLSAYLEKQGILHVSPPREEILAFYEQNKEGFRKKERVDVRHILVQVTDAAPQPEKDAARIKITEIAGKIRAGENFATLADQHSDCRMSKEQGGSLGFIEKGFMPSEFDEIAFSMEPGSTSEVFATKFGYHIIQVNSREAAGYVPVEQTEDFIRKFLQEKYTGKMRLEHVKELRKKAEIATFLQ
ncbi:MAG: peptidylprolyl isomerase [Thermodesulfobacteriota bacterium]